jgi:ribosome-associated protein
LTCCKYKAKPISAAHATQPARCPIHGLKLEVIAPASPLLSYMSRFVALTQSIVLGSPCRPLDSVCSQRMRYTLRMPRIPISIDESLIDEQFVRSPGPGGQNVNKVATAVQLRYALRKAGFPEDMRRRLERFAGAQLTRDGELLIQASRFRSQARNRADARDRLLALLQKAAIRPRARVATKPTRAAKERRLETKRQRSTLKQQRRDDSY